MHSCHSNRSSGTTSMHGAPNASAFFIMCLENDEPVIESKIPPV
jgi:hypothetical protein